MFAAADATSVSRRISACRAILCTVTLAIAIVGAVTGIIGCGIAVVNAVRDRSRVVIGATTHHLGAQRKVVITVANNGRQPALVVDAGVGAEVERFGRWPRRKVLPMVLTATPPDGAFPRKIDPFDAYTWTVELAPGQSAPHWIACTPRLPPARPYGGTDARQSRPADKASGPRIVSCEPPDRRCVARRASLAQEMRRDPWAPPPPRPLGKPPVLVVVVRAARFSHGGQDESCSYAPVRLTAGWGAMRAVAASGPLDEPGFLQVLHRVSCTGRRGVRFREPRRRGAFILVKRRLEAGMPRTNWLLAAAAVLPLLVPPSAVSYPPGLDGHGDQLREGLWGGRVQGGLRSGGGDGARGRPPPPVTDAPERGLPWYKSTLTIRAEDGGEVHRPRLVTVVPSAGLMRWDDGLPG